MNSKIEKIADNIKPKLREVFYEEINNMKKTIEESKTPHMIAVETHKEMEYTAILNYCENFVIELIKNIDKDNY